MDVIFLQKVKTNYPNFIFKTGKKFTFKPPKTIIIGPDENFSELLLLHELSHAILKHYDFQTDVERLKMESEAWQKAQDLAELFSIKFDADFAESELDSYRNWLHIKSKCKKCKLTRYQTPDGIYHCPHCDNL